MFDFEPVKLNLPHADVSYYPLLFKDDIATTYFNDLLTTTNWQQDDITVFGKTYPQPRLTALFGNNNTPYSYSTITMHPQPFSKTLLQIKATIEAITNNQFTTCLANLYRDGNDSNGWHADDEKELGKNPIIASVSFGADRVFHLKHKHDKTLKTKITLEHGSLLLMQGETQHYWLHQLPKTKKQIGQRINLTFRVIK